MMTPTTTLGSDKMMKVTWIHNGIEVVSAVDIRDLNKFVQTHDCRVIEAFR